MQDRRRILSGCCAIFIAAAFSFEADVGVAAESGTVLTGKAAIGDWTKDTPGVRRKITVQDLPPASTNALAINLPRVARRPADARLRVPPGFKIDLYADGFRDPRFLLAAPNGDIFVVESHANQIRVLRDTKKSGGADTNEIFTEHDLNRRDSVSVSQWRYQSARASAATGRSSLPRRVIARRGTLDPRHRFLTGWQEDVRVDRFTLECVR
jgi:glucose/arabinose dehydrogenase